MTWEACFDRETGVQGEALDEPSIILHHDPNFG